MVVGGRAALPLPPGVKAARYRNAVPHATRTVQRRCRIPPSADECAAASCGSSARCAGRDGARNDEQRSEGSRRLLSSFAAAVRGNVRMDESLEDRLFVRVRLPCSPALFASIRNKK